MGLGIDSADQPHATAVSRRTLFRSGATVAAAGYLARTEMGTASAQTDDNWPMQGFDPENTRYSPNTTALKSGPTAVAQADIAAGPPVDYLLTAQVAYLHSEENGIGAISTEDGELEWQLDTDEDIIIPEGMAGDELLARGLGGTVYSIDSGTGEIVAEIPLAHGYGLGYNGREQWFAPLSEGKVVAGEVGSAATTWETSVDGVAVRPAVANDHVFVSTIDTLASEVDLWEPESLDAAGRLYALDAEEGTVSWEASRVGAGVGAPVVRNGMVYWAGADGDILTFDAETGERGWEFKTNGSFLRSPAATDNAVLVGSDDGHLYGIDMDSGEQIGRFSAGSPITSNPVVVGGVVYFGTEDGSVYALEYESGDQLWEFDVGWAVRSLAPSNGRVVVGTGAGYYVLGSDGSPGGDNGGTSTTQQTDAGGINSEPNGGETEVRQRGLFSNGGDEPEAVSDPFNLTTLGFLLSVVGIGYQMIEGR
jgi:outer membrane protein assembly factor BamB